METKNFGGSLIYARAQNNLQPLRSDFQCSGEISEFAKSLDFFVELPGGVSNGDVYIVTLTNLWTIILFITVFLGVEMSATNSKTQNPIEKF